MFLVDLPIPILWYPITVNHRRRGLSLLEVVFAAFIFSSLVTMLSGIWVYHARAQRQTGLLLVASDLADLEMNRALALGYHDLTESSGDYEQVWETNGQLVTHRFQSQVEVQELLNDAGVPLNMKLVRVTLTYEAADTNAPKKSLVIDSVVSNET